MGFVKHANKTVSIGIVLILIMVLSSGFAETKKTIKLGFVGSVSGMTSDMDINARDGVIYAVEKINEGGGILGREIELIIKDDMRNKEIAKRVDTELLKKGAVAIIGHSTSSMTIAGKSIADHYRRVLISPTAASDQLFGKEDYVVCVNSSLKEETMRLAKVAGKNLGTKKVVCFYDVSNPSYSENYLKSFTHFFEKHGGIVVDSVGFNSKKMSEFWDMVSRIDLRGAKGALIIAAPLHSAILVQKLRDIRENIDIFCVSWALTSMFLKEGGRAIEGVWFCSDFNPECKKRSYLNFRNGYKEHFGKEPDLISMLGYETVTVLKRALEKNDGDVENLIKFIPGKYNGIQESFVIDKYGDTYRNWFLLRVKNGKFVTLMKVEN